MDLQKLKNILSIGETIAVEFKRCGNGISNDAYETVCSFLNRFGGDIFFGVEDNGIVCGIPKNIAGDIARNFINMVSNPDIISPTVSLSPEILEYEGKTIIHVRIPPSSEVHTYKRVIYDRAGDTDVKIKSTGQIAAMYIRKQRIFTEKKIYPYVKNEHLRLDMLPRIRQMAQNRYNNHPWRNMADSLLLQSAALIGEDLETGDKGYNLAAIMLLGRDEVIRSILPVYRTDAIMRKVNVNRYDDRLIVDTNLIDSYDLLMGFAEKHLWDKFYLEGDARISLSSAIAREMLVNTLIHREFTSTYIAKFIIERDKMYTENANRATTGEIITPGNFEPNPKNPIIAAFFRNIGLADELGSGVRNLYYYGRRYSGQDPQLIDGDVFRIIVPLDDNYSYDAEIVKDQNPDLKDQNGTLNGTLNCTLSEKAIIEYVLKNPKATQNSIAIDTGKSLRSVKIDMAHLKEMGVLVREGSRKNGIWVVRK
ncbi:MAG: putative DNA binding domain-containing protein [Oscillospiraceae bacterium]|nr:putative DNA binding domain-containing protein [Oscillospiraceae bacterium]